jgi:hypothetical protein
MSGLNSRLRKLRDEARTKNRFSIAAAASDLLEDTDDLDRRINLLGAMQSEGLLRNSLAPYWRELRDDETAWARACLARLVARDRDHDFWAVAALLGCRVDSVLEPVAAVGLRPWSLRWYTRFDAPAVHVASLSSAVAGAIVCRDWLGRYDARDRRLRSRKGGAPRAVRDCWGLDCRYWKYLLFDAGPSSVWGVAHPRGSVRAEGGACARLLGLTSCWHRLIAHHPRVQRRQAGRHLELRACEEQHAHAAREVAGAGAGFGRAAAGLG